MSAATAAPAATSVVVARMPGSLPMGGVVPNTPIHAWAETPAALAFGPAPAGVQPQRTDIDLAGLLAFTIDPVISPDEANALIAHSEALGFLREAPGISTPPGMRMNKSVHWVADDALLGPIFQRMAPLLPAALDGDALYPRLSHRLNIYRYDDNDVFNPHTDGDWPGFSLSDDRREMLQWPAHLRSKLTMLLYLNGPEDGVVGGHTRLYRPDRGAVDVVPRAGAALFFRHGFGPGSVLHEGARVLGSVAKYVARINVMYDSGLPGSG